MDLDRASSQSSDCGAGFSGDRTDAAVSVVRAIRVSGGPGALLFETLAECTLALRQRAKQEEPEQGYAPLLEEFLAQTLADCMRGGITIVSHFGAANPPAAARAIQRMADAAGRPRLRIAILDGDDVKDVIECAALTVCDGDGGLVATISDKDHRFTLRPDNVLQTAQFMATIGLIKQAPKSVEEMFLPESAGRNGD